MIGYVTQDEQAFHTTTVPYFRSIRLEGTGELQ
jgi:hypothetical protein